MTDVEKQLVANLGKQDELIGSVTVHVTYIH